ncbi:MAG: accessory gene regulator B family protein [Lachnospiraceae bacterium]
MILQLATWWVEHLVPGDIEEDDKAVYLYGAECFINEALSDIVLFIGGLLLGRLPEVILWTIGFTVLRVNVGGYHAPSHFLCISLSTIVGLSSVLLNPLWIRFPYATGVILVLIILLIAYLAPVLHRNRPISLPEQAQIKRKAIIITVVESLLICLFWNIPLISASLTGALVTVTVLAILGYFVNPK